MAIRLVTIDFWNTMVDPHVGGLARKQQRIEQLQQVLQNLGRESDPEALEAVYQQARRWFEGAWQEARYTPPVELLVRRIWQELGLTVPEAAHQETVRVFEEGLLQAPPAFAPGLREGLQALAECYGLCIVSDTMFSPGRVIRRLLEEADLHRFFRHFVFSDETGYAKPDPRAFLHALSAFGVEPSEAVHIGDLQRTDVAGAQAVGMRAILYVGLNRRDQEGHTADAVAEDWREVPRLVAQLEQVDS
ncbi:MAG: HAD family hydrolase [Bacteroidetes bacterium]|nr:HAD family hydrolase [Rhodothermia bacterium]MCS7155774.1 HAD family hydrolase [Bacteroidota bacterium]MCX7906125.1 HAD family hydrolase [Bacteroidota bacterium]MDW8138253.1 HAD family hydrolase [Bacteroidota bacterium]MDW8285937.1 HAD family hydrolase [Bacteroidota bacterium]